MKLKYGSDCSGIEAPLQALMNLNIDVKHVFSSESDPFARKSLLANYKPGILYNDIYDEKEPCELDLYCCGFPCQSFSTVGLREGVDDPRGRIFERVLEVIEQTNTKIFLLENVKGLLTIENGEVFQLMLNQLLDLGKYEIHYKVLNTKDYAIPQNRERVYIVGIRNDLYVPFEFPEPLPPIPLSELVDWDVVGNDDRYSESKATFLNLSTQGYAPHRFEHYSPCLTAQGTHWNVKCKRKATADELLRLQGFQDFEVVVSYTQLKKQLGNSMSVSVLEAIFDKI